MSSEFSWADRVNIVVNACCEPCFSWVNACLPCLHPSDSFTIPTWSLCRRQPIQLPHDHNNDDTHDTTPHSHHHASTTTAAAPFDSVHSLALVPEEQRRSKEERRARRTEKKIARALAARASLANEFEGFQGSGQAVPLATAGAHNDDNNDDNDESDDHADLDGIVYTRTRRSASHSDSRSRTSTSTSKKSKSSRDSTSIASPISPTFNGEQRTHIPPYTYPTIKDRTFPSIGFAVKTGTGSRDGAFLAHSGDDAFDGTF